jgi:NAD(P)H-dependent FMN reductase
MKLVAIVGTNADFSYNRLLLQYMQKHFQAMADIKILEIDQLPAFSIDEPVRYESLVVSKRRFNKLTA